MAAPDQVANVVRELRGIKYLLALLLLGVVAYGVFALTATSPREKYAPEVSVAKLADHSAFYQEARDLLMQGAYDDLIVHAQARMEEFPGDPYAYWALGMAHYRLRSYDEALHNLEEAQRLVPQWEEAFTGAYINAARMLMD